MARRHATMIQTVEFLQTTSGVHKIRVTTSEPRLGKNPVTTVREVEIDAKAISRSPQELRTTLNGLANLMASLACYLPYTK